MLNAMSTTLQSQDFDYEGVDSDSEPGLGEATEDEPAPPTLKKYESSLRWWRQYVNT